MLYKTLTGAIENYISGGIFPLSFKIATISPIDKGTNKSKISNYGKSYHFRSIFHFYTPWKR